jgi:uncharacterized protein YqjF (DUF2071 family)
MRHPQDVDRLAARHRPKGQPVMHQTWGKLLFMHWRISENLVRPHVPEFTMWDVRALPPFVPPVPGLSALHELNVRTYVHHNGVPGVWFFSLDTNSHAAVLGARSIYHLPYYYADIELKEHGKTIDYRLDRDDDDSPAAFKATWKIGDPLAQSQPGSKEFFLTERYILYAEHDDQLYRARIHHEPWPLQEAELKSWGSSMVEANRLRQPPGEPIVHYAEEIDVEIWYLEKVD